MARHGGRKGSGRGPHARTSAAQGVQPTIAPVRSLCASVQPHGWAGARDRSPSRHASPTMAAMQQARCNIRGRAAHTNAALTAGRPAGRAGGRAGCGAGRCDAVAGAAREAAEGRGAREQARDTRAGSAGVTVAAMREYCSHYMYLAMVGRFLTCLRGCLHVCLFAGSFCSVICPLLRLFAWFPPSFAALLSSPAVCVRSCWPPAWLARLLVGFLACLGGWLFVCVCAQSRVCLFPACLA